jgi:heme oxygenase
MPQDSLRTALRTHTAEVHKQLDAAVGDFSSAESYSTFVAQSYAFRSAVEPSIQPLPNWVTPTLADALRRDLDDLRYGFVDTPILSPTLDPAASLGRLYVLEGSSMGARVLYERARKLGFSETYGARHLAMQANDLMRWKQFVTLLNHVQGVDHSQVLSAAQQLFEFAITVYSEKIPDTV